MTLPRLLVVMGSGETSPTMVKAHRDVLARVGGGPAVLLDTPYGFQGNADDLTLRARRYFRDSVGVEVGVASLRSVDADPVVVETALAHLRAAAWVFAGPGSPTYALEVWRSSLVPKVLAEKLMGGGALVFASAAALTLGVVTVPVYEIYKVGAGVQWREGLDLLSEVGIRAAVIPHFDNAEGGSHDTRFCYLGEERLVLLERELPDEVFVLGVDEHTGLVVDLDAGRADVVGLGAVTIRAGARSRVLPARSTVGLEDLRPERAAARARDAAAEAAAGESAVAPAADVAESPTPGPTGAGATPRRAASPLLASVARHEAAFGEALAARDVTGAVRAVLALEEELTSWSADSLDSDEPERGRSVLRSMVVRLGQVAEVGVRDPATVVGPFVDALLAVRAQARGDRRFADADAVRDALVGLGVEVQDRPDGTAWSLLPSG